MSDLWAEASADHEALAREAALARAGAELEEGVMPFLLASRSPVEFGHRMALAADSLAAIAEATGVQHSDLVTVAVRRYELMREALDEGVNVLQELETVSDSNSHGSGPEKPDEHTTGPDFAHDYAEIPQGAPQGPDPAVTRPRPPGAGPVTEATGSLRRRADANQGSMMMPSSPSAMTGSGSAGTPPSLPAGVTGNGSSPPAPPDMTPAPDEATTQGLENFNGLNGITTAASADPVRRQVLAVTAAVASTNPQLPQAECERVARVVVGRYFQADLTDSVMSNGPVDSGGGSGDGNSSGGGGMSGMEETMLGRQLINKLPGGGGGAGLIGDAGELAAL